MDRVRNALGPSPILPGSRGDFSGAPLVLSDSIANPSVGQIAMLNSGNLSPGNRTPYWIDEVRIAAVAYKAGATANGAVYLGQSAFVDVKFSTGRYDLMRDWVPMGVLAPRFGNDESWDGYSTAPRPWAEVRWVLPKPLYMSPGEVLQCQVRNRWASAQTYFNVYVTYVGRQIAQGEPPPAVRQVPYAATWNYLTASKPNQGDYVRYAASNDQFVNPFSTPLWIQRFTMRGIAYDSGAAVNAATRGFPFQSVAGLGPSPTNTFYPQVRIADSLGYSIVPEYTPVNDVFDGVRGAWTFGRGLGPREQINFQVLGNLADAVGPVYPDTTSTPNPPNVATTFNYQFGLIGYREEAV